MTRDALKMAMLDSLRMNRSVVVLMLGYVAFAYGLGRLAGFDTPLRIYDEKASLLMLFSLWMVLVPIVLLRLYRERPEHPIAFAWQMLIKELQIVERAIVALPCIVLFPVFSSAFTSVKSAIGHMHPFAFDALFAEWDRILHGGHAWDLIHPLVAYPMVTFLLNVSYNLWIFYVWITFGLVTVMIRNRQLREQYLLSFFACWILLGSLAAIALSSAGPCFYGLLFGTDPYAELMSYLRSVDEIYPIWALSTQDMIWQKHISNTTGLGSGISAMPSMHLAMATLNAILLAKLSRGAGILGWIYLGLILVGSVHLGWHYAIDGYVSMVAVLIIWRAAGWWIARSAAPAPVPLPST